MVKLATISWRIMFLSSINHKKPMIDGKKEEECLLVL
jgi:hypothetical protein